MLSCSFRDRVVLLYTGLNQQSELCTVYKPELKLKRPRLTPTGKILKTFLSQALMWCHHFLPSLVSWFLIYFIYLIYCYTYILLFLLHTHTHRLTHQENSVQGFWWRRTGRQIQRSGTSLSRGAGRAAQPGKPKVSTMQPDAEQSAVWAHVSSPAPRRRRNRRWARPSGRQGPRWCRPRSRRWSSVWAASRCWGNWGGPERRRRPGSRTGLSAGRPVAKTAARGIKISLDLRFDPRKRQCAAMSFRLCEFTLTALQ